MNGVRSDAVAGPMPYLRGCPESPRRPLPTPTRVIGLSSSIGPAIGVLGEYTGVPAPARSGVTVVGARSISRRRPGRPDGAGVERGGVAGQRGVVVGRVGVRAG